ncbi:MAG: TetR/AcrR family transcriptional regulator C-terminal domain-containing protein [Clostridia bacterium]|nr:TetR/AcrR family transcriptional regulator C-terminal domain-containing protein [Clostridia bacterium]
MAIATKRLLAESLKKLLETRTLDKITVKEIVQDCGVNRQTFYYNFQDIYDLVEWIFQEEEKRIVGDKRTYDTWKDGLNAVLAYLQDDRNRSLVLNACQSLSRPALNRSLKARVRPIMEEIVDSQMDGLRVSDEDRNFVIDAFVIMMDGVIFDWLDSGMQRAREEQVERMVKLVDGSVKHALIKMAE